MLELAAGTGRNLPYYHADVTVTAIEPSPQMLAIAKRRAAALGGSGRSAPRRRTRTRVPGRKLRHGGSGAGIIADARLRARPALNVKIVLADSYPNFSICGISYYVSGEVCDWRTLAHRTVADRRQP